MAKNDLVGAPPPKPDANKPSAAPKTTQPPKLNQRVVNWDAAPYSRGFGERYQRLIAPALPALRDRLQEVETKRLKIILIAAGAAALGSLAALMGGAALGLVLWLAVVVMLVAFAFTWNPTARAKYAIAQELFDIAAPALVEQLQLANWRRDGGHMALQPFAEAGLLPPYHQSQNAGPITGQRGQAVFHAAATRLIQQWRDQERSYQRVMFCGLLLRVDNLQVPNLLIKARRSRLARHFLQFHRNAQGAMRYVETGDAAFDKEFYLFAEDDGAAKAWLDARRRQRWLAAAKRGRVEPLLLLHGGGVGLISLATNRLPWRITISRRMLDYAEHEMLRLLQEAWLCLELLEMYDEQ